VRRASGAIMCQVGLARAAASMPGGDAFRAVPGRVIVGRQ
jgi:hypothetical protein